MLDQERLKRNKRKIAYRNTERGRIGVALGSARNRAKAQGVPFELTLDDLKIPTYCPVFNIPLNYGKGMGPQKDSPSLDRIDPSKGYIRGNVQIISNKANVMKQDATKEDLLKFANWIINELPNT